MGSMVKAECDNCGYESLELFLGAGMMNFKTACDVPAMCFSCRDVVTVNVLEAPPYQCDFCEDTVRLYSDPWLIGQVDRTYPVFTWSLDEDSAYILPSGTYRCPRCKQMYMRFFIAGNWD